MADCIFEMVDKYFRMEDWVFEMAERYFQMADCSFKMAEFTVLGKRATELPFIVVVSTLKYQSVPGRTTIRIALFMHLDPNSNWGPSRY